MVGLVGLECDGEGIMLSRWYEADGLGFTPELVLFLILTYDLFWSIPSPAQQLFSTRSPLLLLI
jgi:hypothetical protein